MEKQYIKYKSGAEGNGAGVISFVCFSEESLQKGNIYTKDILCLPVNKDSNQSRMKADINDFLNLYTKKNTPTVTKYGLQVK